MHEKKIFFQKLAKIINETIILYEIILIMK